MAGILIPSKKLSSRYLIDAKTLRILREKLLAISKF